MTADGAPLGYDPAASLITTGEAAELVHVAPATIRTWKHRGTLTPVAEHDGRPLYRPADVWDAELANRRADPAKKRQRAAS